MNTRLFPFSLAHLRESAQPWVAMFDRITHQPQSSTAYREGSSPRQVILPKGQVLTITREDALTSIQVDSGLIWLTETPATRDYVVAQGEKFDATSGFPIVIQALEESLVVLA